MRRALITGAAVGVVVAALGGATPQPPSAVQLSVPGRVNAEPWIAAQGQIVAVTWVASTEKGADVFVAVSRDAGATFAPPLRANDRAGTAREQVTAPGRNIAHPQIVVARDGGVSVLWDEILGDQRRVLLKSRAGSGGFGPESTVSGAAPATYPVAADTAKGLVIAWREASGTTGSIAVRRLLPN